MKTTNRKLLTINNRFKKIEASGLKLDLSTRFAVDSTIRNWIKRTQDVLLFSGRPRYKVSFTKYKHSHTLLCKLEIRFKFRRWKSSAADNSIFGALNKAIQSLTATPIIQKKSETTNKEIITRKRHVLDSLRAS